MTILKKFLVLLIIFVIFVIIAFSFSNCSKDMSPVASNQEIKEQGGIKFLSFGKSSKSLQKVITATEFIEKEIGGKLSLEFAYENVDSQKVDVDIELEIQANSIVEDNEFTMSVDDEYFVSDLDVTFGPHGTQFSIPALLNISVKGIDLSGVNPDEVFLYYDNQETGEWELMECDVIEIDAEQGLIKIVNGKLPHFSRYAIGQDTTGL